MIDDFEQCYRAVTSRDTRFDGWFFTGVTSTHIYCRPSCPAITPKRSNVRFYPTAASAQQSGFRACMRCRPDASPGSPEWDMRADVAARAMKLIADGIVDREGVAGLASQLGFSVRQIQRVLVAEVGTGPLALARAQRAQTARILMETTDLPVAQVAFAAGFSSVRQFNGTIREVFAMTPSDLRRKSKGREGGGGAGSIQLRLPYRAPLDAESLFAFLAFRAVPGVESYVDGTFLRSLDLPHGEGIVELTPDEGCVRSTFYLQDLRDLTAAVARCRRLLDLDADPVAVDDTLSLDPLLRRHVRRSPGKRMPGAVDGAELAVRGVIGQQISVAGARTVTGQLVGAAGRPLVNPRPTVTHLFPTAEEIATAGDAAFAMPGSRRRTLEALAAAIAEGTVRINSGEDPVELEQRLLALPGIGPWTTAYISMRALGHPDAFMPTDLGVRRGIARMGHNDDLTTVTRLAEKWRPWRAYAMAHLWSTPLEPEGEANAA
ncbi:MAG TPA: AlkA N-terminal domain-containing protein [Acidimicrobiales bacterium]|nr:AlkA N-terminal domain-containing protein [Acidimicrobiales bacterium]